MSDLIKNTRRIWAHMVNNGFPSNGVEFHNDFAIINVLADKAGPHIHAIRLTENTEPDQVLEKHMDWLSRATESA